MRFFESLSIIICLLFAYPSFGEIKIQNNEEIMKYSIQEKDAIQIVGISMRTSNKDGQAAKDIPIFWNKFFTENTLAKIPNKKSPNIFCLYTNYEGDFLSPYTIILGCEVEDLNHIPNGMISKTIPKSKYAHFEAQNPGAVLQTWTKIWQTKLERTYLTDFEIYSKTSSNTEPHVDIFVGIK